MDKLSLETQVCLIPKLASFPLQPVASECGGVGDGAGSDQAENLGLSLEGKEHPVDGFRQSSGGPEVCMRQSDSCVEAGFVGSKAGIGRPARRLAATRWNMVEPELEL